MSEILVSIRLTLAFVAGVAFLAACQSGESRNSDGTAAWFTEEASVRGINFRHLSGYETRPLLPEIVGGGVALADVDGDGDLDIYFVQSGWNLEIPLEDQATPLPANELYLNAGDATFEKARQGDAVGSTGYGMGVAPGDYDNDGDIDLYVTNLGPNALLQNDGSGRFRDVTDDAGVGDEGWSTAATFNDFDLDGDLDLFVVNYLRWTPDLELDCYARGELTYCLPTNYNTQLKDRLYRNNGDGTFQDVTSDAGIDRAFGNGLGVVTGDFNLDSKVDIFVANDTMENQLWLNQGGLKFINEAVFWGCSVDDHGIAKAGMGTDLADLDDDGDDEVIVVNFEGQTDSLFRNETQYFVDSTSEAGLGKGSRAYTRFGVVFADFDNDGVFDLYEANGKVDGKAASKEDVFAEPNMLFKGIRTERYIRFEEVVPKGGVLEPLINTSRAAAVGDLNEDGFLDIVVVNRDAPPYLLMNQGRSKNHWVRFRVADQFGRASQGIRISGMVGDDRKHRSVKVSSSYLASHDPRVHFGLGEETTIRNVHVTWLSGEVETFGDFNANEEATLIYGHGKSLGQ